MGIKNTYTDQQIEEAWIALEDIPIDYDEKHPDGYFSEDVHLPNNISFPAGTDKEKMWHFFDDNHSRGVAYLLYEFDPYEFNQNEKETIGLKKYDGEQSREV